MSDKLTLIEDQRKTIKRLALREANAKAEYQAAKKLLEQAEKQLTAVIDLGEDALKEQQPLLADLDEPATNGKPKRISKKAANEAAIAAQAPLGEPGKGKDKSWKSRPVKDALSIGSVVNALEHCEPPVMNLGELQLWLKKHSLLDLPGVGQEKAAKAADQLADFWKDHPEYCG